MFGMTFLITQYFQFVLGYSPLETGLRFLPWAAVIMIGSPLSSKLVDRFGTKVVVTSGLSLATLGLLSLSTLTVDSHYWPDVILRMMVMAAGMSLTMAPATESIMSSLPLGKAGVGSAVNDTTRQVGGAMGVAIIGSVLSSIYASKMGDFLTANPIKGANAAGIKESLGAALGAAKNLAQSAPDLAASLAHAANSAFVDGMQVGIRVAAVATLVGAIVAFLWLPARARREDVDAQDAVHAARNGSAGPRAPAPVVEPGAVEVPR
jgi:Na+/melibiose symporter-like transporter